MITPGYNPLTKAFDEAKTFRIIIDDPPAGGIASWTFALHVYSGPTDKTPELTKTTGISVVDSSGTVEVAFTITETADFDIGIYPYRLVKTPENVPISFGPLAITNVAPGGTDGSVGGLSASENSRINWLRIINTPTTLAGYGITDGATGTGDALRSSNLDQFLDVTQTTGKTLAITDNTTLAGGLLSGVNTGDQTNISGNAATVSVIDAGADPTCWFLFSNTQTGNQSPATNANATFNAATGIATFASPNLTGVPTAPTAAPGTNTTQLATTAFVIANSGVPTAITVANEATDATCFLGFFTGATGDLGPKTNANLTLNSSTGVPTFGAGIIAQKAGGTASYLTASLIAADGTTPTKGVRVWYDAVNDVGQIQAVDSGVAFKNLVLQGAGGGLGVGIGCVPVWSASLEIASGSGAGRFRFSESSGIVQFGAVTNTVSGFVPLAIAGSTLALQAGGVDAVTVDANRAVTMTPASSAIGQRIKLAATPSAHALDIDSSGGSGGNLAYISQTGGAFFAGGLLIGSATPSFGDTFAQINRSSSEATYPLTNPATQGLAGASLLLENTNDGNNTHVCVSLCPVSNSWAALLVGRKTASSSTAIDFYTSNSGALVYAGTIAADGKWGVGTGTTALTALLNVAGSTTARASINVATGTAPTSPTDGDFWYDGTHFYGRVAGVTKQLDN